MPRSLLSIIRWRSRATTNITLALIALLLLSFAEASSAAQQRRGRKPSAPQTSARKQTSAQKSRQKTTRASRGNGRSEESRVTITSDVPLNDYSALSSGNRYFVVIPQADASRLQSRGRGRGFDDIQVTRRGTDAVVSFRLQPGTVARVEQKFNKLNVVFKTSGEATADTATIASPGVSQPVERSQSSPRAQTRNNPSTSGNAANTINSAPPGTAATRSSNTNESENAATLSPTPAGATVDPLAPATQTDATLPAATSPATESGQTLSTPAPADTTATTVSNSNASQNIWPGANPSRNWLWFLIPLLLISFALIAAARLKSRRKPSAASKTTATLNNKMKPPAAALDAAPLVSPETTQARKTEVAATRPVSGAAPVESGASVNAPVETVQMTAPVDVERVEAEMKNLLEGRSYDAGVIGATDAGTRQLVAAGLLAALTGRNQERHERARAAFIKHAYLEDTTRDLRTADAPAERTSAARSLGLLRERAAAPHLIAALEDEVPEVRRAAVEALAEVRDPSARGPLQELLAREKDRKIPRATIERAIEASAAIEQVETSAPAVATSGASTVEPAGVEAARASTAGVEAIAATPGKRPSTRKERRLEKRKKRATKRPLQDEEEEAPAEVEATRAAIPDVEAERLRAEEEAAIAQTRRAATEDAERARAAAEQLRAEQEAQQRAEEETRSARDVEAARLLAEENVARELAAAQSALRQAEEELNATTISEANAITVYDAEVEPETVATTVGHTEITEYAPPAPVASDSEPFVERNDVAIGDWFDVDVSKSLIIHTENLESASSNRVVDKTQEERIPTPSVATEPVVTDLAAGTSASESAGAEKDFVVMEKDIVLVEEQFSTVPDVIRQRLNSDDADSRAGAVTDLGRLSGEDSFHQIIAAFDDPSTEVRNAAARALFNIDADRAASFTRALREAAPERRRKIGAALASSGLAGEAINSLMGESREKTYDAFSLLFLMSKAGETQPLLRAIEEHPNNEVRLAIVKLLALSGQQEILPAFRRLAMRGSLPTEVRSAVMEAIYQISNQASDAPPAA